uniref:BZIP domain-containing protein n=1 Tax=Panagrellus redivivus TaxID=6233 RepID=A0A7E4W5N1_PANRE
MPRRSAPRSPEEEEEYRRRRRERNTEIQRERRRRLKSLRDGGLALPMSGPSFVTYESTTDSTPSPDTATESPDDQPPHASSPDPIEADPPLLQLPIFDAGANNTIEIQRRRRIPLLPTRKKRTPEEEAAYAAHRRARNTEIQRRRRQRIKEESMLSATTSPTSSTSSSGTDSSSAASFDQSALLTVLQFCLAQIQTGPPSLDGNGTPTSATTS